MSYQDDDKFLAGNIKSVLENYGLEVFLAHEDIRPATKIFEEEIINNLRNCDIFMPLLTINFRNSNWTDQETGMAVIVKKFIIPLKVGVSPHGFIEGVQAFKFNINDVEGACRKIIDIIKAESEFKEKLKDCIIEAFSNSHSFNDSEVKAEMLEKFDLFTTQQVNKIVEGFLDNDQNYSADETKEFLSRFESVYSKEIESSLKERLKEEFNTVRVY